MIAVDTLGLFLDDEIKTGKITRSYGIFIADLLDGFVEIGEECNFV